MLLPTTLFGMTGDHPPQEHPEHAAFLIHQPARVGIQPTPAMHQSSVVRVMYHLPAGIIYYSQHSDLSNTEASALTT